jgi:hypothetical protein
MNRYTRFQNTPEPDIRADMVVEAMKARGFKDAANNFRDRWQHYNERYRAFVFKAWSKERVL